MTETNSRPLIEDEIDRFVRSGENDPYLAAWDGNLWERAPRARHDLRSALVREVNRRATGRTHQPVPTSVGVEFTRAKVEPMVRGLFPRLEQEAVLRMLEKSVVYVTAENIDRLLLEHHWDSSAWDLANLYLLSVGAELLGEAAPRIVGLSEEMTCFVSPDYFSEQSPDADFIVHEAAHVFHNCKRRTLGLPETRTREWLLEIAFQKRETFAYACEAFGTIVARARSAAERRRLGQEFSARTRLTEENVDVAEVIMGLTRSRGQC